MKYILPANAFDNFPQLLKMYEEKRHIKVDKQQSLLEWPILLGGVDAPVRSKQIHFLMSLHAVLKPNLLREEDIKTSEQWNAHITAARTMTAACLYVLSQIDKSKRNSILYSLLEDMLNVTVHNALDDGDKDMCCLAAKSIVSCSKMNLYNSNEYLKAHATGLKPLSVETWNGFSNFLDARCTASKTVNPYEGYPFTSITKPLFGAAGAYMGATFGFLGGEVFSRSSKSGSTVLKVTNVLTPVFLYFHVSTFGIAILAPAIATKIVTTFFSISLGHLLSVVLGVVGQGIGMGVGLPLDLAYKLLSATLTMIKNNLVRQPEEVPLSGVRIEDGMIVKNGLCVERVKADEIPEGYEKVALFLTEDNKIVIDGKQLPHEETPSELLVQLKEYFAEKERSHESVAATAI